MKNAIKGALLSGLIFPGLGQIVLKSYKRGIGLMIVCIAGLIVFVIQATQKAFLILENIAQEGGAIDMGTISNAAGQASAAYDSSTVNIALLLIIVCWVIGVVDAYRIGMQQDAADET